MNQIEARTPKTLVEIAETDPKIELITSLKEGFEQILLKRGEVKRSPSFFFFPQNKWLKYSRYLKIDEERSIPLTISKEGTKKSKSNFLFVDIGMRCNDERVSLMFIKDDYPRWQSGNLLRPPLKAYPTKKDLELYKEVLEILQKPDPLETSTI
jgi:hypothetical protein